MLDGLIPESLVDRSVKRLFTARLRLGMFDPPEMVPYAQIPYDVVDSGKHRRLALRAARSSLVLLKNDGVLPLPRDIGQLAVIGPYADDHTTLRGNYNGTPGEEITILEGIRDRVGRSTQVLHAPGSDITGASAQGFEEAYVVALWADAAIVVLGSSPLLEGEEGAVCGLLGDGDRRSLELPGRQEELLKMVHDAGVPVVLVLTNGSALSVNWADENVAAIIEAWYPGQAAGTAVADVIFGRYNPAGRLPVTFYKSLEQLPPFEDYSMTGHTYRYFRDAPLYPFGYGLSYTRFAYRDLKLQGERLRAGRSLRVSVTVENAGERAGEEVVQLYLTDSEASVPVPVRALKGFRRIRLAPGKSRTVRFRLSPSDMSVIDAEGRRLVEPGRFQLSIGGGQPYSRGTREGDNVLTAQFEVTGRVTATE